MNARTAMPLPFKELLWLFGLSGFAGLIYESIWTHYLKLLLGHAAFAQTLVLGIFMGGLALGAWLAGRYSLRFKRLLFAYAAVEILIAALALAFHPLYVNSADWLQISVLPTLGSPWLAALIKWLVAAALIAPQSILLGMTFPLMSAGALRIWPEQPGRSIALLYFINSLGACIGVLCAGFALVPRFGLPGAITAAGILNLLVAAGVIYLSRRHETPSTRTATIPGRAESAGSSVGKYRYLLLVACLTGLASFIYELVWIRMLSMVLGAATHSFELMLSAFISGLALGGWWLHKRIDALPSPLTTLARVQVLMGAFALFTLAAYGQCFELMSTLMQALARSDTGYQLFMLASHGITLLLMLPTTICAGMTLPLITHIAMSRGAGEKAIGHVYAINTFGAIAGIVFTVHIGLPLLGLKPSLLVGAAIDLGIGLVILWRLAGSSAPGRALGWSTAAFAVFALASLFWHPDPRQMAAGVYRYGLAELKNGNTVLFHRDGRTATVNLVRQANGHVSITTNGKPDAAINMGSMPGIAVDEPTMILAGALPLSLRPQARTAAVIGMGSGLTTATLLASKQLDRVDTIEIEPAMIEAANGFRPRVSRVYEDPRSRFHIDDARSFFSTRNARYDLIVSEPSNPWVSGVANLFSEQFYAHVKRHLNEEGLFLQWVQLYEIDVQLVASVIKALGKHFPHYALYSADNADMLIVASIAPTGLPGAHVFEDASLRAELQHIDVLASADIHALRIGDRNLIEPVVESFAIPANSDFYPVLDFGSARARFLGSDAQDLPALSYGPLPIMAMLDAQALSPGTDLNATRSNPVSMNRLFARTAVSYLVEGVQPQAEIPQRLSTALAVLQTREQSCESINASAWESAMFALADRSIVRLSGQEAKALFERLRSHPCVASNARAGSWFSLYRAVAQRQAGAMYERAEALLAREANSLSRSKVGYLLGAGMLGAIADSRPDEALQLWSRFGLAHWTSNNVNFQLRTLIAIAQARSSIEK